MAANSVYIRVNTGWDPLVELNQTPNCIKQIHFKHATDAIGNAVAFDDMPDANKYNDKDYYGLANLDASYDVSVITCEYNLPGASASEGLICLETNDASMKNTKSSTGAFTVSIKSITDGVYANYYYSYSNRGLGFIRNIKSYTYYNNVYKKELIQVGNPETGLATVNMPPFIDVNLTCYNIYSEYEADTGKFVRSVMLVTQEGASVDKTNRQFCIRTKRNFYTPVVFSYVPHEDNLGYHNGGTR